MSKEKAADARAKAAHYRMLAAGNPDAAATYIGMAEWWERFARELEPTQPDSSPDKPSKKPGSA